ncbi:MAG: type II secretion system F family protein [Bacilli bacterium]|nr:type II secretion system F family protein [Bacilli bacterium]
MPSNVIFVFVVELVLIYLIAVLFYYVMLLRRKVRIEERLGRYTIYTPKNKIKIFDDIFDLGESIIKRLSNLLYKLKIFDNYSLKYQKYIHKEETENIDKMDFVSRKIIFTLLFILIVVFYDLFRGVYLSIYEVLFSGIIGFYILDIFLISETKLLKREKENDLLRAITIMNNSFKSGHSIMQGIKLVSEELDSPMGLEFKKMYVDLTYGLNLDIVFKRFEERVNMEEVKYITTSLSILNETGGDIVKVFESVEKTFFNNKKIADELKNLTAASKLLFYVLLFIPIIFVAVIYALDNTYFNILFVNTFGYLIIVICLILYISYIFIIRKIMRLGDIYD